MKRILYASGGFLTDDEVADALMQYASVLAIVNSADVVTLPGVDDEGTVREIQLVVGPASQILAMGSDAAPADLASRETVADLRQRARDRLPNAIGVAGAGMSGPAESDAESTSHEPG
ncbi:hypothetical protein [Agromyces aerolatus]|uniref:hypothetical protein n=1 Tax=Agromyces sp. LY-1074 TaxID=3074080 RepID=UPI00285AB587|nr:MULTISPECIES: hypothetical protein [unclassified Agromyces]MDR5698962.1 hypothetical protein [Agromyces sp. LY-1074]MDR5705260.1 hypothetical protein [Agromyces sp. LY-1358]